VPCTFHGDPYFNFSTIQEVSVLLLEKAVAKLYGNYSKASRVAPSVVLKTLTGAPCVPLRLGAGLEGLLQRHLQAQAILIATRPENTHLAVPIMEPYEETVLETNKAGRSQLVVKKKHTVKHKCISHRTMLIEAVSKLDDEEEHLVTLRVSNGETICIKLSDFEPLVNEITATHFHADYFYSY
jgi:hypothetical protein